MYERFICLSQVSGYVLELQACSEVYCQESRLPAPGAVDRRRDAA